MIVPIWVYAAAAAVIAVSSFVAGSKVATDHWKAQLVSAQQDHDEDMREANERNNDLARQLEESRASVRVVYRTINRAVEKVVERPVYRAECVDDDGLRLANDALAGRAPDPGKPDGAVPGPKPAR